MATKFYTNYSLSESLYKPALQGGWTIPKYEQYVRLDTVSFGIGNGFWYQDYNPAGTSPQKTILLRGISRPLLPQTIDGTVDFIIAVNEWSLAHDAKSRLHIYVANATTNTVFATLLNQFEDSAGPEWYQASPSGYEPPAKGTKLSAPQTLTPCTIPGDGNVYRLVIEFGSRTNQPSGFLRTGCYVGSRDNKYKTSIPDLAIDEIVDTTAATRKSGYFLFSATILLEAIPIPNITIDTAITVSAPTNFTIDNKGYDAWYRYTFTSSQLLGLFACTNPMATSVLLYMFGDNFLDYAGPNAASQAVQIYQISGSVVYFTVATYPPYTPGVAIQVDIQIGPNGTARIGDLLILDDCSDSKYPAIWLDPVSGLVRRGDTRFVASELGVSLTNGKWAAVYANVEPSELVIYNKPPILNELARAVLPLPDFVQTLGTDFKDFYIVYWDTPFMPMYKISETGVVDPRVWHVPFIDIGNTSGNGGQGSFGLSRDGLIAYFGNSYDADFDVSCRRFNMVTDVEILPAFGPPALPHPTDWYYAGEVIVLSDNTILCNYHYDGGSFPADQRTVHYAPNGTILHVITHGETELHHIVHSSDDDPDKFWAWTQADIGAFDDLNKFQLIRISTGEILIEHASSKFYMGESSIKYVDSCSSAGGRFGATNSCPLIIMREPFVVPPNPLSGIYKIVPNSFKSNDTVFKDLQANEKEDRAIPRPTWKTGLIGG